MHESKIVSLKARTNNNNHLPNKQPLPQPTRNNLHYQRARQMSKLATQGPSSTLLRNQKAGYPAAFYSPSGRSLSFNNIAMSSEEDSSSEEYEIYEELSTVSDPNPTQRQQEFHPNGQHQPLFHGMDPHFTRQLAEMYTMLSQRQHLMQNQGGGNTKGQMNAANSAVIDELALRMYHALQMNHLQSQNAFQNGTSNRQLPQRPPPNPQRIVPQQNGGYGVPGKMQQAEQHRQIPQPKIIPNHQIDPNPHVIRKNVVNSVHEHPVDLPMSSNLPSRNINVFKSATSQQIHNLYTSQLSNKSSVSSLPECDNKSYSGESTEKEHMYETIPYQKSQSKNFDMEDIHSEKPMEHHFLYPAEKEFEHDLPCKDGDHITNGSNSVITQQVHTSPCLIKDNLFCPIKENNPAIGKNYDNYSAFQRVNTDMQGNISGNKYIENCELTQMEDIRKVYGKNVQPAIATLMMNIPKPPTESYSAFTKSSSSQTEIDFVDEQSEEVTSTMNTNLCLTNDDSFVTALNCTSNSITDSLGYSSSSSLNSSSSGSTISSAGSCYYYVDTQNKPQFMKFPTDVSDDIEEAPLIDLRSPTLPTMGVSMLSKKRNTSSSGSEHGSNAGSRASPCVPAVMESDFYKTSRIVTDVGK